MQIMFSLIKVLWALITVSLVQCDYPFYYRSKFRPSPQFHHSVDFGYNNSPFLVNQQYVSANFAGPTKPLFEPASVPYPAETPGQIDNYNKALLEEAQEASGGSTTTFDNGFTGFGNIESGAKSYVDVRFGTGNLHYQYKF